MYAGNVGFSQSLEMVIDAARAMPYLTFVINGDGAARRIAGTTRRRSRQHPLLRLPAARPPARGTGNRRHPSGPAAPRTWPGERPVEDVFDPRRWASGAGDDRSGNRDTADPRANRGAANSFLPTTRWRSRARCEAFAADPRRRSDMGIAARRWVEGAVSPASVAQVLRRPDRRAEPAPVTQF